MSTSTPTLSQTDTLRSAGLEVLSTIDWQQPLLHHSMTLALRVEYGGQARVYPLVIMRQNEATTSAWAALARAGHQVVQSWLNDPARPNRLWLGVAVDGTFKPYPCTPQDFGL